MQVLPGRQAKKGGSGGLGRERGRRFGGEGLGLLSPSTTFAEAVSR